MQKNGWEVLTIAIPQKLYNKLYTINNIPTMYIVHYNIIRRIKVFSKKVKDFNFYFDFQQNFGITKIYVICSSYRT